MTAGKLPDYPVRGAPMTAAWGREVVDALRARTVKAGPGLLAAHSGAATIISLDPRPRRVETVVMLPWHCALVTEGEGEEETQKIRVYPGPREVIGGHAEWKAPPNEAPYWELDFDPEWETWTVVYRYRHPRPDWKSGGIIAGAWGGLVGEGEEQEHVDAPEVLEGSPGPAGVCDDTEYRRIVLAVYDGATLKQLRTGMLSALPILDRAACLEPPEEPA